MYIESIYDHFTVLEHDIFKERDLICRSQFFFWDHPATSSRPAIQFFSPFRHLEFHARSPWDLTDFEVMEAIPKCRKHQETLGLKMFEAIQEMDRNG